MLNYSLQSMDTLVLSRDVDLECVDALEKAMRGLSRVQRWLAVLAVLVPHFVVVVGWFAWG